VGFERWQKALRGGYYMCVSGMLPDTHGKGKGFFAKKQANR